MRVPYDRKRKPKDPCEQCQLHREFCLCEDIPKIDVKTRLSLVVHKNELRRTSNTGRLATLALVNSEVIVRGVSRQGLDLAYLDDPQYTNVLFYPAEGAQALDEKFVRNLKKPLHLIVPDGNWRQASKVHTRHKELAHLPRVMFSGGVQPITRMRSESTDYGMATLEAVAYAMGQVEGQEVKKKLMDLYHLKTQRVLVGRGIIPRKSLPLQS